MNHELNHQIEDNLNFILVNEFNICDISYFLKKKTLSMKIQGNTCKYVRFVQYSTFIKVITIDYYLKYNVNV